MEPASLSQSRAGLRERAGLPWIAGAFSALAAGAALRFWMVHKFFEVRDDTRMYGDMAKNLLLHGQYALSDGGGVLHSTLIRLPGYPLFLAACFQLFGMENYFAPVCVQILLELVGCVLLADMAWRLSALESRRTAAQATLWLAALCPFTAIYAAEPLTEALTLFTIALALWAVVRFQERQSWGVALAFTFAVSYAALLRPDGALVGVALVPPMLLALVPRRKSPGTVRMAIVCMVLALAPFAAWTWRNWRVFHVIQPLAPRYATDPGEETWPGWQRWMKTWCLDFTSTYEIYWNMPGQPLDVTDLPQRAFDSPAQRAETEKLFADYRSDGMDMSPALDQRFAQLAQERIAAHPLRYYFWLPLGRVADMWFRPRIENLPIDFDWWVYSHHRAETRFSWFYFGLNAAYLLLGAIGLWLRPRLWAWMLLYFVLRSVLLSTIEAPEARYTIECFPMLFVLGGIAIGRMSLSLQLALENSSTTGSRLEERSD